MLSVPIYTALYSTDSTSPTGYKYYLREKFFEHVYAYALAGGNDIAYLHDSTGDDTFVAEREAGTMTTSSQTVRAEYFERPQRVRQERR